MDLHSKTNPEITRKEGFGGEESFLSRFVWCISVKWPRFLYLNLEDFSVLELVSGGCICQGR